MGSLLGKALLFGSVRAQALNRPPRGGFEAFRQVLAGLFLRFLTLVATAVDGVFSQNKGEIAKVFLPQKGL